MINNAQNFLKRKTKEYMRLYLPVQDLYEHSKSGKHDGVIEGYFETSDGRSVPVMKHHRYSLKKCWAVLGPVAVLHELNQKGLLDPSTQKFFKQAIGHRTLTVPMEEVRSVLAPFIEKYQDLFLSSQIPNMGRRLLTPTKDEVESLVALRKQENKAVLDKISNVSGTIKNKNILEIGYTSGGESLIAFERLGFKTYGLDNFYDKNFDTNSRHEVVKKLAGARTEFLTGDITKETPIEASSLDLIYTQSVLEHIQDLPSAFCEMYRLLKPGGLMYHRYDPYFYIRGAHSQSTLDSPWAHMRLNQNDIEKYIKQFRPYEADIVLPWIRSALNRKHTQTYIQSELTKSGFQILWWQNKPVSQAHTQQLTPDIIAECLAVNDRVSLNDLLTNSVAFIVKK